MSAAPQWEDPDESIAANIARVYAAARHAAEQCGRGPLTLYTTSSALAEKLRTVSGYPVVNLSEDA